MALRMRRPETTKLDLGDGDWLLVKKHLTAGEQRAVYARMIRERKDGGDKLDPVRVGWSKIIGYLIDWSVTDADGKPVSLDGKSEEEVGAALDALDTDSFSAVRKAIEDHEAAMDAEREKEKNDKAIAIAS